MALRLERKPSKGPDGKIRYYWTLYDGRRYVAYIGKEPKISPDKLQELQAKGYSLEDLKGVPGLKLEVEQPTTFWERLQEAIARKDAKALFCQRFNDPERFIARHANGFPEARRAQILGEIARTGELAKRVILAFDQYWDLRLKRGLRSPRKYTRWLAEIRKSSYDFAAEEVKLDEETSIDQLLRASDPLYDAKERLEAALAQWNDLFQSVLCPKFSLHLGDSPWITTKLEGLEPTVEAKRRYGDELVAREILPDLWNFHVWVQEAQRQGTFPIGVCRYRKCRRFFVKKRRGQLYCSPQHKVKAFYEQRHRE